MNDLFRLINSDQEGPLIDPSILTKRPIQKRSLADNAHFFDPGAELETAMNTAIALNEPLLITGEPGTGKTQAAYYAAYKLNIEPVIHFQVKSDTKAKDLLYHFDSVRYFHDAALKNNQTLDKKEYIEPRELWTAMSSTVPRILLIDEIDKATRDFPNDLLMELDQLSFKIIETSEWIKAESPPIVFITSNSERKLPEAFLRRCVYHHITFDSKIIENAVMKRRDEYPELSEEFLRLAIERFLMLRNAPLRKPPSTAELIVWLRVLGINTESYSKELDNHLSNLPYLGVLIKDHQDLEDLTKH